MKNVLFAGAGALLREERFLLAKKGKAGERKNNFYAYCCKYIQ
jgi:hypothetical protein